MKLRQIARNQKLINFDYKLKGFISEADDEKVDPKDAFAGMTKAKNPSKKYWYVKDGKYKAVVDPPKEGGWELADKKKAEKEKKGAERRDTSDDTPDDDIDFEIEDDLRDNINSELALVGLKPSKDDKNVFVDEYGNEVMAIDSNGDVVPSGDINNIPSPQRKEYVDAVDDINAELKGDEPQEPDKADDADADADAAIDTEERDAPEVTEGPMDNEQINEELDYIKEVTGKNKRLESGANPKESSEWTNPNIEPTPNNFEKWQKESGRGRPKNQRISMSDALAGPPKVKPPYGFPKKYVEVLERMINTEGMADPKTDAVGNFIDGAGAGMIQSQAGEILTMMLTSIPDDAQAQAFADKIGEVLAQQEALAKKDGTKPNQILDKSWVKAAMENRASTMAHVRATYGPDAKITSGCWDLESEVEAMGLPDYKKNKGYSTDAYFTVETPNHPEADLLLEVSLKKDAKVMFYNGGTGDILKPKCVSGPGKKKDPPGCAAMGWGLGEEDFEDVEHDGVTLSGDSYNPAHFQRSQNLVYRDNMAALTDSKEIKKSISNMNAGARADLIKTLNNRTFNADPPITEDNLETLGPELIQDIMGNYENQFDEEGNKVNSTPSYATKRMNKVAMLIGKNGEEWTGRGPANPPPNVSEVFKRMDREHKGFQQNLAKGLLMNKKLKSGLMGILRDEFPIKAAATGEEIMSIGDMVLDRKTCQKLFGTANFNDIKERLSISEEEYKGKGPKPEGWRGAPIITYSAQGDGKPIPLANVDIRQKGIGYDGYPSFNLMVHPGFAKALKGVQGALQDGYVPFMSDVIVETKQNTLSHHLTKVEEDYSVDQFIREINEGSLN